MPSGPRTTSSAVADTRLRRMAFVAARLHGVRFKDIPAWAGEQLQVEMSARQMQDAVGPVRGESPHKKRPGRQGSQRLVRTEPIIQDALVIEEPKLGLLRVLLRITNDGRRQDELLAQLEELDGVRQVIEIDSSRELLVIALANSLSDADDLRARVEDLAPERGVTRELISFESHAASPRTWKRLVRRAADETSST